MLNERNLRVADLQPLPRCCPAHPDWTTLTEHLRRDFHELDSDRVAQSVLHARRAVELFGIDPQEHLEMAEIVIRHQLSLLAGRLEDVARLDPQSHPSRARCASDAA